MSISPVAGIVDQDNSSLFQVSVYDLLEGGAYDGIISAGDLNSHGDQGVGTFDKLNGELIQVNGTIYQALSDGTVQIVPDSATIPFGDTVRFQPEYDLKISENTGMNATESAILSSFPTPDLIYAIRITGSFPEMKVRSVPSQEKPYPPLEQAVANQSVFDYPGSTGTMVGFWMPSYLQGINTGGYHLHFLSDDKMKGGHVLNFSARNATVEIDPIRSFSMDM